MSLMGDAISHSVLPGVAFAYMTGLPLFVGATTFGLLAAFFIGFIQKNSKLKSDTVIGIVLSAFFSLGFILVSFAESSVNLHHILFGNVLAVTYDDIFLTVGVLGVVVAFITLFYKELQITSFDENFAKSYGLKVGFIQYALIFLLTIVTVVSLQTVGVILIVAMLITPAATAFLWTKSLAKMLWISSSVGVVSSVIGMYISYTFNLASGPAIVLVLSLLFAVSFALSPQSNRLKLGIMKNRGIKDDKKN
jgi:iron/zinc/copper transport system permease protein